MQCLTNAPLIDVNATTGILWSVKAFHAERLKQPENAITANDRARSSKIITIINLELTRRLGDGHVMAV